MVLAVGVLAAPAAVSKLADQQDVRPPRPTALTIDAQTITGEISAISTLVVIRNVQKTKNKLQTKIYFTNFCTF